MRPGPRSKPISFCSRVLALCLLRQLCDRFRRPKRSIFRCLLEAKERFALTFRITSREGAERPPQESHAITVPRGSSSFTDQLI